MRKSSLGLIFIFCYLQVLVCQEEVTWAEHIGCIVYTHCTPCHNDKGIAPFALSSYPDAFAYRYAMEEAISQKIMPPWPPNPHYKHLAGERLLSEQEIQLFKTWVEEGAAEGDPDQALEPPVIETNRQILEPDFSFRLPDYVVPDLREIDLYRCFRIAPGFKQDKYITGVEVLPGNRSIVHHVLVYADTTGITEQLDAADPGAGYTCFGGIGSNSAMMLAGWVPGSDANFTPDDMGILLPAGSDIVVQVHYPEGSVGQMDSTRVNFQFAPPGDTRRDLVNLPVLNHFVGLSEPLFIPANTRKTFHATQVVPFKLTATGIAPHAHLICESMRAFATTPFGDTIRLIDIPHWDFEWQGFYDFQQPVVLPFGSVLHGTATYNNTTSNPHLPFEVPRDVSLGEATTDEMMLFFMSLALYQRGDEDRVIDTTSHKVNYQDCMPGAVLVSTRSPDRVKPHMVLGPNPAHDHVFVSTTGGEANDDLQIILVDLLGNQVMSYPLSPGIIVLDLPSTMPGGIYYYFMQSKGEPPQPWQKLVLVR